MKHSWFVEMRRVAIGLAVLLGAGFVFGHLQLFVLAGAIAYLSWQLFNLYRLHRWLESPKDEVPHARGIWSSVFSGVSRIRLRDIRRRQRLRKVVEDFRQAAEATPTPPLFFATMGRLPG